MKILLAVLIFGFAIAFNSFSAPTSAEQLRSEFETAMKANDTNAILALVNWRGVSAEMKSEMVDEIDTSGLISAKLLPLPTNYQLTNELNGVRYFPNVHVVGFLGVNYTNQDTTGQIPYGENGGVFYIAGTVQETFDTHAKKAISLGVMVMGLFPKETPGILTCSYVYVADGNEKTGDFQCTNNWSEGFWGDYIKSCKVTKISGSGSYELEIHEGTNTIFDSDMVETNDSISYEKTN